MNIIEARKKHAGKHSVKDKGYMSSDDTQLIFKSELLDKKGVPYLTSDGQPRGLIFLVHGVDHKLPEGLQGTLTRYVLEEKQVVLPSDITYSNERFKVPLYYLPAFVDLEAKSEVKMEELFAAPEPIETVEKPALHHKPEVVGVVSIANKLPDAVHSVVETFAGKPNILADLQFLADLTGGDVQHLVVEAINKSMTKLEHEVLDKKELSNLLVNIILLNQINKNESN